MKMISTQGLNKADVLAALYNASKPQGMGFMHYDPKPMTRQEADAMLSRTTYFDYLKGRVMKVELKDDAGFDPRGYDRDNGEGAAGRAIDELRRQGKTDTSAIRAAHHENTLSAALDVKNRLNEESYVEGNTLRMGLSDVAHVLGPKVDEAIRKS